MYELRLKLHWNFFLGVQLTTFQHWFRLWLGADKATSHYLNQWSESMMINLLRHICVAQPQWVKAIWNLPNPVHFKGLFCDLQSFTRAVPKRFSLVVDLKLASNTKIVNNTQKSTFQKENGVWNERMHCVEILSASAQLYPSSGKLAGQVCALLKSRLNDLRAVKPRAMLSTCLGIITLRSELAFKAS